MSLFFMLFLYALVSVIIVSLVSFSGLLIIGMRIKKLEHILIYLVALSAGAFFGDIFFHLMPEMIEQGGFFTITMSVLVIAGLVFGLFVEKVLKRRHCHLHDGHDHIHSFAHMNLIGDMVHNCIDGLIIGASYMVSIEVGIATTIAVILHEIPQEIGDFGVLVHGGYTVRKALRLNFLTAFTAVIGCIIAFALGHQVENLQLYIIPFTIGMFIYIAGSDLIPELHKDESLPESLLQILCFIAGVAMLMLLLLLE